MKICIVTTAFPRWEEDYRAPFIFESAKSLQELGNQIRVIAMHEPGSKTYEIMHGIEIFRTKYLPERWQILRKEEGGIPVTWQMYPLARLALAPFLLQHLFALSKHTKGFDIIHAHWTLSGLITWMSKPFHHRPYIITVHGSDLLAAPTLPVVNTLIRKALVDADQVIAVSKALADKTTNLGVPQDNIIVVPDGVDTTRFYPIQRNREPILLFVGSMIEIKGVEILMQAFSMVVDLLPHAILVLIGEGHLKERLKTSTADLGISEKVKFLGAKSQDVIIDWMQRSEILILPSMNEGFGVVLIEALACGTPCIASNVGGIKDILSPEVGISVPPGDAKALGEAIIELYKDPHRRRRMQDAARKLAVNRYDWKIVANRLHNLYLQIIQAKNQVT